jgi:diguanylate cyclase (GGDEF)-like protein
MIARAPQSCTLIDSPYAEELRRARFFWRFKAPLEAEYLHGHLSEHQLLIRVACVFAAVVALLRGGEQLHTGSGSLMSLTDLAFVIGSSAALAALAWSPFYHRLYLPSARILIPIRNAIVAAQLAATAAHGQLEMLMVLPLTMLGPFFLLGLGYRDALFSGVLTVAAYVAAAAVFAMPLAVAIRSDVFLSIALLGFVIAGRHLERSSRLAFLEGRLLTELAQTDSLTGTSTRRVFDERLSELWQRAVTERHSMALLLIDIDHFKAYNDRYGHQAGDQALSHVAQALGAFVRRPTDILARYGGEEFAVILYDTGAARAKEIAEQMRQAVAELQIAHHGARKIGRVTLSLGVAVVAPNRSRSPCGALQLADEALYEAKVGGRNRVELRDEEQHDLLVTGVFESSLAR